MGGEQSTRRNQNRYLLEDRQANEVMAIFSIVRKESGGIDETISRRIISASSESFTSAMVRILSRVHALREVNSTSS